MFSECSDVVYERRQPKQFNANLKSLTALSRLGSLPAWFNCTLVVLINLADAYFAKVNCQRNLLVHVMCTGGKPHMNRHKEFDPNPVPYFCHSAHFLKQKMCFNFEWLPTPHEALLLCVHPKQFSYVFQSVQATRMPSFKFNNSGTIAVTKYDNFVNYSTTHKRNETFCIRNTEVRNSKLGGNVLNCSETFNTAAMRYLHIGSLSGGAEACFSGEKGKEAAHSSECEASVNITMKCRYLTQTDGRKVCSPLFSAQNKGQCEIYLNLKSNLTSTEEHSKPVKIFQCKNTKHIPMALVDDLIEDCMAEGDDEKILKSMLQKKAYHICALQSQIPCREGHSRCFNVSEICQYRLNSIGHLFPCRTGEHMHNCTHFECNKMFKCYKSHCIPWEYTCNGRWDCIDGLDESVKQVCGSTRLCKHLYLCKSSQICIHLDTVCDNQVNCPHGEDEELCDLKQVFCPKVCQCVAYAVHCVRLQFSDWSFAFASFLFLNLKKSLIRTKLVTPNIVTFHICESLFHADNLCFWMDHVTKLHYLSVVLTTVDNLQPHCFAKAKQLAFVKILNANMSQIDNYVFSSLAHLRHINLSSNPIKWISDMAFQGLPKLHTLSLLDVVISDIKYTVFEGLSFSLLETNTTFLCCWAPPEAACSLIVPSYFLCSHLLQKIPVRVTCIVFSLVVFVLNSVSLLVTYFQQRTKKHQEKLKTGKAFSFVMFFVNTADMTLSPPLIILWITDVTKHQTFPKEQEQWQSDATCSLTLGLFVHSICASLTSSNFMAFTRLMVVKHPLDTKFKDSTFVRQKVTLFIFGSIMVLLIATPLNLFVRLGTLSVLCSPFCDPTRTFVFLQVLTWITTVLFASSSIMFCFLSCYLIFSLKKSKEKTKDMARKKVSHFATSAQICVLTISNTLCWGTVCVITIASTFLRIYPYLVMVWTTVAVLPLTAIMNPCIFLALAIPKILKTAHQQDR